MNSPKDNTGQNPGIESLRGIAALTVMLAHAQVMCLPDSILAKTLFGYGFLGVQLFFVVSGFCIHLPYARDPSRPFVLSSYFWRRFWRIYPPYIVVVLLLFALFRITHHPELSGARNFLGHLVFWHYLGPSEMDGMGVTPVLWTVALEVQFYALYAVLQIPIRRWGLGRCVIVLMIIDLVYTALYYGFSLDTIAHPLFRPNRFAPTRFGEWLAGAWIAQRFAQNRLTINPALGAAAFVLLLAGAYGHFVFNLPLYPMFDIPGVLFMCVIVMWSCKAEFRGTPFTEFFGLRCYSLYLVHFSIIAITIAALNRLPATPRLAAFFLAVVMSLAGATVFYSLIERPSHDLARRWRGIPRRTIKTRQFRNV